MPEQQASGMTEVTDKERQKAGVAQATQPSMSAGIRDRKTSGHKVAAVERKPAASLSL